ncbi:hypothetical protein [Planococcus sp. ISL-109]|uniref:hypothetical protein n=1 Tax=Planococcus sp. ISL-109 TaxID=2819166 RepID=UPI001BECBDDD|nr:hypothetical protein [Planococcus sp. ISL-109]MBT2581400.1 hypothetical protein [Planococcus sp. ISL-109]
MKNFSFKARMIYFSMIVLFSIGFFLLQWTAATDEGAGIGSMILLILWGVMALFGIAGLIFSMWTRKRNH